MGLVLGVYSLLYSLHSLSGVVFVAGVVDRASTPSGDRSGSWLLRCYCSDVVGVVNGTNNRCTPIFLLESVKSPTSVSRGRPVALSLKLRSFRIRRVQKVFSPNGG